MGFLECQHWIQLSVCAYIHCSWLILSICVVNRVEYVIAKAPGTIKGEPELTDPFNLLINVKLRMLWNFFYLKEEHFNGNIVS